MPYGLYKASGYFNKLEAWRDWNEAVNKAISLGLSDKAAELCPRNDFGWRRIDACTAKLKSLIRAVEHRDEGGGEGADETPKILSTED